MKLVSSKGKLKVTTEYIKIKTLDPSDKNYIEDPGILKGFWVSNFTETEHGADYRKETKISYDIRQAEDTHAEMVKEFLNKEWERVFT